MLLPAAAYDVYRGGSRRMGNADDWTHPPLNASPGEFRLWQKLHGELDRSKAADEAKLHARNGGRRDASILLSVASAGVVKSGRRAGQKAVPPVQVSGERDVAPPSGAACGDCVRLRQKCSERSAALTASESRVGGLEAMLKAVAADLEVARAEGEQQAAAVEELESKMVAAAEAERERTQAMAARMGELMQSVAQLREEAVGHRAEREAAALPDLCPMPDPVTIATSPEPSPAPSSAPSPSPSSPAAAAVVPAAQLTESEIQADLESELQADLESEAGEPLATPDDAGGAELHVTPQSDSGDKGGHEQ